MHPTPLQINLGNNLKKIKLKKGKEMCNLFRACLYFEEDILNQNRYSGRTFFFLMPEVTDIPLLIRKYCIIKKGKSQTGHWADSIHAFLVSSVTRKTLTYDVT